MEALENALQAAALFGAYAADKQHVTLTNANRVSFGAVICADGKRMVGIYKIPKAESLTSHIESLVISSTKKHWYAPFIESSPGGTPQWCPSSDTRIKNWIHWDK